MSSPVYKIVIPWLRCFGCFVCVSWPSQLSCLGTLVAQLKSVAYRILEAADFPLKYDCFGRVVLFVLPCQDSIYVGVTDNCD